jgi:hypothetical protein
LIVAMVAAAMLVAMAVPAYAQELVEPNGPNGPNDELNLAVANLKQECEIDQEQNTLVVQTNEQNTEQNQTGGIEQSGPALFIINTGDVNQSQSSEQNAANVADVKPIQANSGDVKCDAAIAQLQDSILLLLFGGLEPNGEENGA